MEIALGSSIVTLALFIVAVIIIIQTIRVVPQQHALVIERWVKFHAVLEPVLNFVVPTVDREKRAVIANSEGRQQEQINLAAGARAAAIAQSEGVKQAEINTAQGQAAAILAIAEANAKAIRQVAEAISSPGGMNAVNLKVAEQYVAAFGNLAKTNNTLIVPTNLADLATLVTSATTMFKAQEH